MHPLTVFLVALALAMDAFAVAVASGIAIRRLHFRHALTIGAWFGCFQAIMPLLGWLGGHRMKSAVSAYDHWIAGGLLVVIGAKMIREALSIEGVEKVSNPTDIYLLFVLSVATSVDALAMGITFAILNMPIVGPVVLIGAVTFLLSMAGVWIGHKSGHFIEKKMAVLSGIILIGIAVKIVVCHEFDLPF